MQEEVIPKNTEPAEVPHNPVTNGEMRRGRELLGMSVYSIAEGKHLGDIQSLRVRREDLSVPVLGIRQTGSGKEALVRYAALTTVGVDIVLVDAEAVLSHEIAEEEREGLETALAGRPVFTQSGERAGSLAGFGLDTATGRIAYFRVEAETGFWSRLAALGKDRTVEVGADMVVSLGPDAVIVQDGVLSLMSMPVAMPDGTVPLGH